MIYMKSTSGNDGSYTLTVSFAVGTDPDINTVNVQNRVKLAEAAAAGGGASAGRERQEEVVGPPAGHRALLAGRSATTRCSSRNYATINMLDALARVPGVGDAAILFGALDYSMRIWIDSDRLTSLGLTPNDIVKAIQAQNMQAAVGRIGAQPIGDDQQFQLNIQTKGRLDRRPRSSATSWCAPTRTARSCASRDVGAGRARRARPRTPIGRFNGKPGATDRASTRRPAPTRSPASRRVSRPRWSASQAPLPRGRRLQDHLRHHRRSSRRPSRRSSTR